MIAIMFVTTVVVAVILFFLRHSPLRHQDRCESEAQGND
jgi:hypothetical protein